MGFYDVVNAVASPFNTIAGVATNLIGGANIAKAQREANEQNERLFHENVAANERMQDKALSASSILNQARQMQLSGVNPAGGNTLGLSQGSIGGASSSLPSISPVTGFGAALQETAQIANLTAQTENIKQDTENKKSQGGILESEDTFQRAILDGKIASLNAENGLASFKLSSEQDFLSTLQHSLDESFSSASYSLSDGKEHPMNSQYINQLYVQYQTLQANLNDIANHAAGQYNENWLFELTKDDRVDGWHYDAKNKMITYDLNDAILTGKIIENGTLQFDLDLKKRYGDAQAIVGMFGEVADGIGKIGGVVNGSNIAGTLSDRANTYAEDALNRANNAYGNLKVNEHRENRQSYESSKKYGHGYKVMPSGSSIPKITLPRRIK